MPTRRLPDVVWPKDPTDDEDSESTPTPDPYTPVVTPQQPSVIQETLAGSGSIVPIVYGLARLGGQISIATTNGAGSLVLCVVWCMGEVNSITVKINDESPPSGVSVTSYLGTTTQGVNATLASAIPGYSDNLVYVDPKYGSVGIAYSVITIAPNTEGINGFPRITADIQGRKVWCCVANGYVYSTNPALVLADLIRDPILGMRREVDLTSQTALQAVCDEIMGDGAKRRTINLSLTNAQEIVQWLETIRGYAGCMLYFEGDKAVMVPNRPGSPELAVTSDLILKGSMKVTKHPKSPNVVRVAYTDISAEPWRTNYALVKHPDVTNGLAAWDEESISMPGIHNYGQAYREAEERLNSYRYCDTDIEFVMMDEGLRVVPGTIISVTHPVGFSGTPFRVKTVDCSSPGRWRITAGKYSSSVYSNSAPSAPPFPNIKPPTSEDPEITEPPGGGGGELVLTEIFSTLKDGTPISKIQATWSAVTHPNLEKYEIQWKITTDSGWNTDFSASSTWTSPQVFPTATYQVRVRTVATDGAVGTWLEGTVLIDGKTGTSYTPPSPPTGRSGTLFLELEWSFPAGATDISHTEVWVATSNNFGTAVKVAAVAYPGTKYVLTGLGPNICRYFWVKFVDTSNNVTGTYPSAPNGGIQLCTPSPSSTSNQDLLNYLSDQILDSHLNNTLRTKINRAADDSATALVEIGQIETEVYGEYYVKIDANGRVAGFGLYNSTAANSSLFLVKADRFAIAGVGEDETIPFVVDTVNNRVVMSDVYMSGAWIDTATITNAQIVNLTLGTEKIQNNAISRASAASTADMTFSNMAGSTYTYNNLVSVSGANVYAGMYVVNFKAYIGKIPEDAYCSNYNPNSEARTGSLTLTVTISGKYGTGSITFDDIEANSTLPITIVRPFAVTPTASDLPVYLSLQFSGNPSYCYLVGGTDQKYENTTVTFVSAGLFLWQK